MVRSYTNGQEPGRREIGGSRNGHEPERREIEDILFRRWQEVNIRPSQNLVNAFAGAGPAKLSLYDYYEHTNIAVRMASKCGLGAVLLQLKLAADSQNAAKEFIRGTLKEKGPRMSASGRLLATGGTGPLVEELYDADYLASQLIIEAFRSECGCRV